MLFSYSHFTYIWTKTTMDSPPREARTMPRIVSPDPNYCYGYLDGSQENLPSPNFQIKYGSPLIKIMEFYKQRFVEDPSHREHIYFQCNMDGEHIHTINNYDTPRSLGMEIRENFIRSPLGRLTTRIARTCAILSTQGL